MTTNAKPVRVLVVDDSAVMRDLLSGILAEDPEIEVLDTAPDPYVAREKIKALNPDVITLDVEMPHMDGVTFLRKIMTLRPMPVVMISTLTTAGAETTLEALEIGAVDFVAKPTANVATTLAQLAPEIRAKVKNAGRAKVRAPVARKPKVHTLSRSAASGDKIIFIGASTGGVEALKVVLTGMPADSPPILITQHMPPRFTQAFAERLNRECAMTISEAKHGDPVEQGHAYIAPGSHHLEIAKTGGRFVCALNDGPTMSGHRPSVDTLFQSAAKLVGANAVAAILTGMGKDGANGMREMRNAGAFTIGQDEATSLIYGMPRVAFEVGGVMKQSPLGDVSDAILAACHYVPAGAAKSA